MLSHRRFRPRGEASAINAVHVTMNQDAPRTLQTHQAAFRALGLDEALNRYRDCRVQPGVEFDHTQTSTINAGR